MRPTFSPFLTICLQTVAPLLLYLVSTSTYWYKIALPPLNYSYQPTKHINWILCLRFNQLKLHQYTWSWRTGTLHTLDRAKPTVGHVIIVWLSTNLGKITGVPMETMVPTIIKQITTMTVMWATMNHVINTNTKVGSVFIDHGTPQTKRWATQHSTQVMDVNIKLRLRTKTLLRRWIDLHRRGCKIWTKILHQETICKYTWIKFSEMVSGTV